MLEHLPIHTDYSFRKRLLPKWAKWLMAFLVVLLYVWGFYSYFVGPTGFRWRALYGDPKYPEGYETTSATIREPLTGIVCAMPWYSVVLFGL